jgi:hypothetical protein
MIYNVTGSQKTKRLRSRHLVFGSLLMSKPSASADKVALKAPVCEWTLEETAKPTVCVSRQGGAESAGLRMDIRGNSKTNRLRQQTRWR